MEDYRLDLQLDAMRNELVATHAELTRLRSDLEKAKEALKPFAEASKCFDTYPIKDPDEWYAYSGTTSGGSNEGAITVTHLRAAARILSQLENSK